MDGGSAHCATELADKDSGFRSKVLPLRPKRTSKEKKRTKVFTHSACEVGVEEEKLTVTCSTGLKTVDPILLNQGAKYTLNVNQAMRSKCLYLVFTRRSIYVKLNN